MANKNKTTTITISNPKAFLSELNLLKMITKGKSTISVLDCVLIESLSDKIIITGTDLDSTLRCEFPAHTSELGAFCVELTALIDATKKANSKIVLAVNQKLDDLLISETELEHTISRYADSGFNRREAITLDTLYRMLVHSGESSAGFDYKQVKKAMPKLIADKLICAETLKHTGVLSLTATGEELCKIDSIIKRQPITKLAVKVDSSSFTIDALDAEHFPKLPNDTGESLAIIGGGIFNELLKKTIFAATTDQSRFTLSAIALEAGKTGLRAIATDGHRLAMADTLDFRQSKEGKDKKVPNYLLNLNAAKCLQKTINGKVFISNEADHLVFKTDFGNRTLTARKPSGNFPNYEMVLPRISELPFAMEFHPKEIAGVVGDALRFTDIRKTIQFQPYYNNFVVKASNGEKSFTGNATCDFPQNSAPGLSCDGTFLTDICAAVDSEILKFAFKNSKQQFQITGKNSLVEYTFVIMPLNVGKGVDVDAFQVLTDEEKPNYSLVPFYKNFTPKFDSVKPDKKAIITDIQDLLDEIKSIAGIEGMPEFFAEVVGDYITQANKKLQLL